MLSNGYNVSSAQQIVDNALLMASLSIRAQLLSFLPTLYRMDINENIAIYCYRRGGTYDGICDLCLKDFPTYNDLKTHKNICINNKFVMNVL